VRRMVELTPNEYNPLYSASKLMNGTLWVSSSDRRKRDCDDATINLRK